MPRTAKRSQKTWRKSLARSWQKTRQSAQRQWKQGQKKGERWLKQTGRQARRRWQAWRKPAGRRWQRLNQQTGGWPEAAWQAARQFSHHQGFVMAAVLAYYAMLSLFPLSLLLLTLSSTILPRGVALTQFYAFLDQMAPSAREFVNEHLATSGNRQTLLQAGSLLILAWTGSSVVDVAGRMVDRAWQIEHQGARRLLNRLRALALAAIVLALLTLSFLAAAALQRFRPLATANQGLSFGLVFLFDLAIFSFTYWALPSLRLRWLDIWPGALLASLLLALAKSIFVWYLGQGSLFNLIYGPLTTVIAFMVWAYISGVILALGAEFSAARRRQTGPG